MSARRGFLSFAFVGVISGRKAPKPGEVSLAERVAHYTTAVRDAIAHASDIGDADTAAVYTDISRGVDKRLRFLESYLHQ